MAPFWDTGRPWHALNKHTLLLFGFALIVSLLMTTERRLMWNGWFVAGGIIALVIFVPNLVWMWQHHFPHLELLANIKKNQRNVNLSPLAFMGQQILFMHPVAWPVWLAGLWTFLAGNAGQRYRLFGVAYLVALTVLLSANGRTYYLLPAYPMLIAGGAIAIESWFSRTRLALGTAGIRSFDGVTGALLAPIMLPLLPPETFIRYTETLGISQLKTRGPTGQRPAAVVRRPFRLARDGSRTVAMSYQAIPARERDKTAIFAQDYGQAGAIDFYGPKLGLPKAISGHLTYWYWGPRGYTGEIILVMGDRREVLEEKFRELKKSGK